MYPQLVSSVRSLLFDATDLNVSEQLLVQLPLSDSRRVCETNCMHSTSAVRGSELPFRQVFLATREG